MLFIRRTLAIHCCIIFFQLTILRQIKAVYTPSGIRTGPSHSPQLTTTLVRPPERIGSTPAPKIIFTKENNTELIAQIGTTVVLHCAAENVGDNTVSWIRQRDYHLLTVGTMAYSSDMRFQVRYLEDKNDWQLHIRYVQPHDEGIYECQVSSHPPVSLMAKLDVVEASSEILGGPEKFLRAGSSLRLVCVLRKNTQPPSYVFWYLNTRMINYDEKVKVETSGELSVLFLSDLGPESSGNYTCVPSNAKPSTIHIQVLNGGEMPAAIHSSSPSMRHFQRWESLLLAFCLSRPFSRLNLLFFATFVALSPILPIKTCFLGEAISLGHWWLSLGFLFLFFICHKKELCKNYVNFFHITLC